MVWISSTDIIWREKDKSMDKTGDKEARGRDGGGGGMVK